jgi:CBS domain containing-hemolysin-like protein
MVPRNEIVAVSQDDTLEELRNKFIEFGVSRIPVYSNSIDNITGYVHVFDMFRRPETIGSIIKPMLYVPESTPAHLMLSRFISERRNIAVVLDEFGGTSGMVTMEDVIEEIFGEIEDEFDEERMTEKMISPGEFVFAARLEIDYLNGKYRLGLPESDEYETLAGLIIHHHESIPAVNETILIKGFRFDILSASGTRIEQVLLRIDEDD